ncbi:MAG: ribonuclease R [Deltaproteobacteria bacterium]|nr:ribonuclease R [Deltaproteobacteria bacterium]
MTKKLSTKNIIACLEKDASRPLSLKELVHKFDLTSEYRKELKQMLRELTDSGLLVKIRGNRYGLPSKLNLVSGVLQCHPNGFAFVLPEDEEEKKTGDVFISRTGLRGAMHGDHVVARVEGSKPGGKRDGRIIEILKRVNKRIVGTLRSIRGETIVIPSDERILDDVIISTEGLSKAGFHGKELDGNIVEVEITKWPAKKLPPFGKIISVIGDPSDPNVEINVIAKKYSVPCDFPKDVLKETTGTPEKILTSEIEGRVDLRDLKLVTIDGETAKDFDDAVYVERKKSGYTLFVSIADVSHYVKENTALDTEAFDRATSVYFPGRCIPMLPEVLSNGICSLNPAEDRLTMTAELDFNASGELEGKKFYESVIRSKERLTYTTVKKILEDKDTELEKTYSSITSDLALMKELALKLNVKRSKDGSIDFDLPEPQIIIDARGRVEDIIRSERNIAHRIIEEFMLAANRAVALSFKEAKVPAIYRIHEEPDKENIEEFKEFAGTLGYVVQGTGPKSFQRTLKHFEGHTAEKLINHVLLRTMKQAVYSDNNKGHFGLAFENYTHFTSPIRRYPDLIVHRLLKKILKKKYSTREVARMEEFLPAAASHTSTKERIAMEAEREAVGLKKAEFMKDKVGEEFDGFISGVTNFGIFVELKDFFVEGLVHITTLGDDYYHYLEKEHALVGEGTRRYFRLGDATRVILTKVDIEKRRLDLELAPEEGEEKRTKTTQQRKKSSSSKSSKRASKKIKRKKEEREKNKNGRTTKTSKTKNKAQKKKGRKKGL